jgi:hypothetical protein
MVINAITAIHGQGILVQNSYLNYTVDASPYLYAWMIGSVWNPSTIASTNAASPPGFNPVYFSGAGRASSFEQFVSTLCDYIAIQEMTLGW